MTAIEVRGLSKSYGNERVLHDVSFTVKPGRVTGLLGPNGSGKSTIMRIMTGLSRPSAGTVLYEGEPYVALANPSSTVGVLLDASAQHPGRTVLEVVGFAAGLARQSKERRDEVIEEFGLASVRRRTFKALSLGMKQRVGLAIALLSHPQALILDEPMNGLDAESIRWLRTFLESFARSGGTVLVSSHQLQELQAYVDDVVVISSGVVVTHDSLKALVGEAQISVTPHSPSLLEAALLNHGLLHSRDGERFVIQTDPLTMGRLVLSEQLLITEMLPGGHLGLEDLYLRLTQGQFAVTARGESP